MTGRPLWLGAGVLTAACLLCFVWVTDDGLSRPDGFDYAQIARELVEGRGFASRQAIYALHLRFLEDHRLLHEDWPNLHRFPLPSLVMAGWFLIAGVGSFAVAAYGMAFHVATSILLFEWTRRAVGVAPAVAAAVLFSVNGPVLETGVSGLAEPAVMFFFTLALFLLWRASEATGLAWPLASGAALGLAVLSRTNTLIALPVFGAALCVPLFARGPDRPRPWREVSLRVAALVLGTLVVVSPWLIRNWTVAGSPMFSLHSYFLLPSGTLPPEEGDKWDVTLPWVSDFESPLEYGRVHPDRVQEKWTRHLGKFLAYYPSLVGIRGLPLIALLGLFVSAGRGLRPVGWVLFGSVALNALVVSLGDHFMPRYHYQALPGMVLLGVGATWTLLGRLGRPRVRLGALAAAVVLMVDIGGIQAATRYVDEGAGRVGRADMEFVRARTSDESVVFSDVSWVVTWETGRRSVRAHFDRRADGAPTLSVRRFNDEFLPVDGVYLRFLDRRTRLAHRTLRSDPWFREAFPNRHRFPSGAVFYWR